MNIETSCWCQRTAMFSSSAAQILLASASYFSRALQDSDQRQAYKSRPKQNWESEAKRKFFFSQKAKRSEATKKAKRSEQSELFFQNWVKRSEAKIKRSEAKITRSEVEKSEAKRVLAQNFLVNFCESKIWRVIFIPSHGFKITPPCQNFCLNLIYKSDQKRAKTRPDTTRNFRDFWDSDPTRP